MSEILSSSSVKMSPRIQLFLLSALVLILGLVAFTSAHEMGLGDTCTRCNVDHFCNTTANLDCCGGTCVCKVGFVLDDVTCVEGQNDENVCAKETSCDSGASSVVITSGEIVMIFSTAFLVLRNILS
ncbi:unnamed protein product [Orchesella dallaii]|uniref:TIL domain-containing protein n=1 Tax=Orchesella dallaii TaxID=48710 RepID=A0ABP1R5W9_9HEXA